MRLVIVFDDHDFTFCQNVRSSKEVRFWHRQIARKKGFLTMSLAIVFDNHELYILSKMRWPLKSQRATAPDNVRSTLLATGAADVFDWCEDHIFLKNVIDSVLH